MAVDGSRSEDASFASENLCARPDPKRGMNTVGDVRIPRATERDDATFADANIGLEDSAVISTTALVMTRSGEPSARVVVPCAIDSRIVLPPPKTASSPAGAVRSTSTSIQSSVSARRRRSPTVGP